VKIPDETPEGEYIYLVGEFNDLDPQDEQYKMDKVAAQT